MEVDFDCPSPRFSLTSPESISEFRAHLDAYGYAVVASAADSNQVATLKSLQWDLLEGPTKCLDRNDHQTWEHPAWYPNPSNGIVPGAGHSEFMWQLRQLPKVLQAFSVIWKIPPSSLITSFDVCNAFRPYVNDPTHLTDGGWWHLDQNSILPSKSGKVCVQGLVSLTDCDATTGGLCVIPGSHLAHASLCESSKLGNALKQDFVPIDANHDILKQPKKLVTCLAGDLCVWDSRLVHCNTPADMDVVARKLAEKPAPSKELLRQVGYVCMTPRSFASRETLRLRRIAYETGISTSHWPHCNVNVPRFEWDGTAGPSVNDPDAATPLVRSLVGYNDSKCAIS